MSASLRDNAQVIDRILESAFEQLSEARENRGYTLIHWRDCIDYAQGNAMADAWYDFARNNLINAAIEDTYER